MAASSALDFESLLSGDHRPARISHLVAQEAFFVEDHKNKNKKKKGNPLVDSDENKKNKNKTVSAEGKNKQTLLAVLPEGGVDNANDGERKEDTVATSRFVQQLVCNTPAYSQFSAANNHRGGEYDADFTLQLETNKKLALQELLKYAVPTTTNNTTLTTTTTTTTRGYLHPSFHQVELGDWEKNIQWKDTTTTTNKDEATTTATTITPTVSSSNINSPTAVVSDTESTHGTTTGSTTAVQLLKQRRNPFLENLDFTISWDSARSTTTNGQIVPVPLLLELGVAGQSVARHKLPNQRPVPGVKSDAYRRRMDVEWESPISSTADISKGSLHQNKEQMEALIQERQAKRAQMAKDKTNRVTEAMGTLSMGGGKGRTITSSLMGPGGTERTGRPSRHMGSSAAHEFDYVEQLDMVTSHALVRDLSKILLRQYHRPKLPYSVVRNLSWQFQIRYQPSSKKISNDPTGNSSSSSYHQMIMGNHQFAGAVSKVKLRNEADLSPSEGKLVLLEYCEEKPPIQLTKGTASKIVNYYRGDKSRCPVSKGGGDRPTRRKNRTATGEDGANTTKGTTQTGETANSSTNGKLGMRPNPLQGPDRFLQATVMDWIGKLPKKSRHDLNANGDKKNMIDILPEGVTEILHPKVHGPFIGEIEESEEGTTLTGLISNLFVAPMFRHEPQQTDFLMILSRHSGGGVARPGVRDHLGVILRELPTSVYCVGQTEPRTRVYAPSTQGEKNFIGPFVSYQIAKTLARTQARDGQGLKFDEIVKMVLPNLELPSNALRQRLKQVAIYDKNTQIWTTKKIGYEDYPGVEALGKSISPEGVAAYETACAAQQRLTDLGLHHLFSGAHSVVSVGVAMVYLTGQLNSAKELSKKMKKRVELCRTSKKISPVQIAYYERAAAQLEAAFKALKQRSEVSTFIYEELQLAPWHLTGEFIEVHKKAEGTGMMQLTGLGDPSGKGEGFNFLREVDSKPSKAVGNGLDEKIKKITGTEDDLRKLTMKQMASLLRSYGMEQKKIDILKRWDRVHVIRDLSTKAASDGIASDGLERFARGEKMKLSEQKNMYRQRIQEIWNRQIEALSNDGGGIDRPLSTAAAARGGASASVAGGPGGDGMGDDKKADGAAAMDIDDALGSGTAKAQAKNNQEAKLKDDSDSDSDGSYDFAAELEEEFFVTNEKNQLLADQVRGSAGGGQDGDLERDAVGLGQLRAVTQDQDLTKEARDLAAWRRDIKAERALKSQNGPVSGEYAPPSGMNYADRKVIRKRITKTLPNGNRKITFKFICRTEEVKKITAKLEKQKTKEEKAANNPKNKKKELANKLEFDGDERQLGHSMFEDEDNFEYSSRKLPLKRGGIGNRRRPSPTRGNSSIGGGTGGGGNSVGGIGGSSNNSIGIGNASTIGSLSSRSRPKTLQYSKLKLKNAKEQKTKKRKREEEADLYTTASKRKGTNNRRERGSIRDRKPHVIFAEKLENIRANAERRPGSGPFLKPVPRKQYPDYYERISSPIDLQSIKLKLEKYDYRTADAFLRDFELMKQNAIKYNGSTHQIAKEATDMHEMVAQQIAGNRSELDKVAEQVKEQLNEGKSKKKKKKKKGSKGEAAPPAPVAAAPTTASATLTSDNVLDTDLIDLDLDNISSDDGSLNIDL